MKTSLRSVVPPFAVMDILAEVERRRAAGDRVWSLCAGEPDGGAPTDVRERAAALLASGERLGYTAALGTAELRATIAAHYERSYGVHVDREAVAVTTGSSGAFVLAFLAALDPGDRVAIARPGYPAYRNILAALGADVIELACGPEVRHQPTPALLDAAIAEHGPLTALVVASPANPTGTVIEPAAFAELAAWCTERGVRLVSDEIYHGLLHGSARATCAWEHDRSAIVVSSFSKFWGMTGWRLGWALLPPELIAPVDALAGNLALCPPALAQSAALAAFTERSYDEATAAAARCTEHRDLVVPRLAGLGLNAPAPADGAFYVYADATALLERAGASDSVELCRRILDEANVALTPGTDFDAVDGGSWVRLSYAASRDELDGALSALEAWVAALPSP
ncbi:MAG: aminotransferase class I/II-fold pyridoxal phosphate-dependent enzyme [Solirubrobacteraceae bacterium]|nr:aminotransferase class I/II-fold pyridoxal phosphate-dependent enzyme [Solirubrobacteraceae bacterium]